MNSMLPTTTQSYNDLEGVTEVIGHLIDIVSSRLTEYSQGKNKRHTAGREAYEKLIDDQIHIAIRSARSELCTIIRKSHPKPSDYW